MQHNIVKNPASSRPHEYVGYGGGRVWLITPVVSPAARARGAWVSRPKLPTIDDRPLYAHNLVEMGAKLASLQIGEG